ncbi:MAG: AAA family ATPase [Roseovarius confluentis]|jgi:predicted ATPase
MTQEANTRHVILSGCSGGGQSTLLTALGRTGYSTVPEPGRRIVAEETRGRGVALPWVDPTAFARRAVDMALQDRADVASDTGWVFFDRGLIDAAVALEHAAGIDMAVTMAPAKRFHQKVFVAPPWPEIYKSDNARRHGFDVAIEEYHRLCKAYDRLGYTIVSLPKTNVAERTAFVLNHLG